MPCAELVTWKPRPKMSSQSKVSEDYDQYLVMLQERNKLLKKLRQKDSRQKELEKLEQGFALYLNGANLQVPKATKREGLIDTTKSRQRTSKTAGGRVVQKSEVIDEEQASDRAKTAPSKRKSWSYDSVRVRAEEGDTVHMKAPGCLSGQYDEDFESPTYQPKEELELSLEDSGTSMEELEKGDISGTLPGDSLSKQDDCDIGVTSDDQSCIEELESTGDLSTPTSPLHLREHYAMLEFESQSKSIVSLISRPSTIGNQATNPSIPANNTEMTASEAQTSFLPNSSRHSTPQQDKAVGVAYHTDPPVVRLTTQSLSAVRRKQNLPSSDEDHKSAEQAVLKAVCLENQALTTADDKSQQHDIAGNTNTNLNKNRPSLILEQISKLVPADFSQAPPIQAPLTHASAGYSKDGECSVVEDRDSKVADSSSSRGPSECKNKSPFKPVLVNRYKSLDREKHSLCETAPPGNQQARPDGHKEWDAGTSESLTEHTLSVITAKVKELDVRKQRRLIQLLNSLDTLTPPLPSPLTQTSTHPHTLTHKLPTFQTESSEGKRNEIQAPTSVSPDVPVWLEGHTPLPLQSNYLPMDNVAPPPRPGSTRMSGLRGELPIQQSNLPTDRCLPSVSGCISGSSVSGRVSGSSVSGSSVSGRVSGLRGELQSRCGNDINPLASVSDSLLSDVKDSTPLVTSTSNPSLLTERKVDTPLHQPCEEHVNGGAPANYDGPRLNTAVLAQGYRALPLGDDNLDGLFFPSRISFPHVPDGVGTRPPCISSQEEPEIRSSQTHWQAGSTRQSVNEHLASITEFDHFHLGRIGSDLDEDILDSFLSEYHERREQKPHHSKATPPPLSPPPSLHTTVEVPNMQCEDTEFVTPVLPTGSELVLSILSTWGDCFYVGLTGIEIYTDVGEMAAIEDISADPSDINILPEYDHDPRVVTNLLDGVNQTKDDLHMWLAPYSPGQDTTVRILFTRPTTLALIRIWNYNKSRIHCARGVRLVEMTLDGDLVFHGEIVKGDSCETILFTTDKDILYAVSQYDTHYQTVTCHSEPTPHSPRPSTADSLETDSRPFTPAITPPLSLDLLQTQLEAEQLETRHFEDSLQSSLDPSQSPREMEQVVQNPNAPFTGSFLQLCLMENWGDSDYIGLAGIQVLGVGGEALCLQSDQIHCEVGGQRSEVADIVKRLLDDVFITTESSHMWTAPLNTSQPHTCTTLTLSLDVPTQLTGLRVWNFNTSLEDSYRGVKLMQVYLDDGVPLSPDVGFIVRKAPGHVEYDFGQLLSFGKVQDVSKGSEDTNLPNGFVFQLQLLGSWGDPYYIGLNGIQVFDAAGHVIPLTADNIAAYPDSVNILPEVNGDLRTPDKLVDGTYDTEDGRHMWLSPILPGIVNSVYVLFDEPCTVSKIAIWNYAKTPSRGVKEISVLVDGLLVRTVTVPSVPTHARGILPTLKLPLDPFVIPLYEGGAWKVGSVGGVRLPGSNDVQLTDNWQVLAHSTKPQKQIANQDLRPITSLTNYTQRNKPWPW